MAREFALIARILAARSVVPDDVLVDAGDDCAVLAGGALAVGNDLSVEGVHFRRSWLSEAEIGFRAATAALSDLAAMAAEPSGVLLALCLGPALGEEEALAVAGGVIDGAERVGAGLLGGDLSRGGVLALDVVAIGRCPAPVRRAGARPGDELWVTGRLGGAAAAVREWERGAAPSPAARSAFAAPTARVQEAAWLAARGLANALIDLSDGLSSDGGHVAEASGVAITLDAAAIPVAEEAGATLESALHGGEDYELLIAAAPDGMAEVAGEFSERFGVELTRVGVVRAGAGVYLRGADGRELPLRRGGFDHLEGTSA
ncbi:MAG TPA: thiamine-phosphate kinase [Longimicrobiales bacterium]|nr:thiamine-phosphate kinase [Longimicrobiales bacterium]